jgi:1-deoxy-D-xylulose-5-phosphate synthase
MLQSAYEYEGPALVRYPRGSGPGTIEVDALETLPLGRGEVVRQGEQVAILAFGSMVAVARQVAETLNASVANMRFIKPLDEPLVRKLASSHQLLVSIEENMVQGGAGSAVTECLNHAGISSRLLQLGLPDRFIEQGTQQQQLQEAELDVQGVERQIRAALDRLV